VSRFLTAHQHN